MASGEGVITRKDIITDDALQFGTEMAKQVQLCIDKVELLKKNFSEYKNISKDLKTASNFKEFNSVMDKSLSISNKYLSILKEQVKLEETAARLKKSSIANEKTETQARIDNANAIKAENNAKRSKIQLDNAELSLNQRKQKVTEQTIRKVVQQSEAYKQLNFAWRQAQQNLAQSILTDGTKAKSTQRLQREFNELDKKVKQVDSSIKNYSKNVGNYSSAFNGLGSFTGQIAGALGWAGAIATAVEVGKSIYKTTKELETLYKSMELGSKSAADYASNLKFLDKITEDYGLELISTTQAYNKFYLAAKNKLSIEEIQLVFDKVSKSAGIMGLTVEQQEGTFKALSDMMSKGTVMAEELKGQLGDRIPVAVEVMAKAVGVGTEELLKMMQNGEIMAADVLPKFAIELEKAVGADQVKRVENLTASEVRLKNAWTDFVKELNGSENVIGNISMWFLNFVTDAIQGLNRLSSSWESLWNRTEGLNFDMGLTQAEKDFNNPKYQSQVEKAKKKQEEYLILQQKELENLNRLQKTYKELDIKNGFGFKREGFRAVAKEIEQSKANLGQIQGYLKGIDTFLNPKKTTPKPPKGETEQQRKKREAAERKAKREAEKAENDAEKAEEKRLQKLKKSFEDEINLKIQTANEQADLNKRIFQDEKSSFENRLSALDAYQDETENALKLETIKKVKALSNFSTEYKALSDEEIDAYLQEGKDLSKLKDDQILIFRDYYFELNKLRKEDEKNLTENANREAKILAANTAAIISGNDQKRFEEIKKIEDDFNAVVFKNNEDRVKANEKRERDLLLINRKYDKINLRDQVKQTLEILRVKGIETEKIVELRKKLAELEFQISKIDNDSGNEDFEDEVKKYKKKLDSYRTVVSSFSNDFADIMGMNSHVVEDFIMNSVDQFAKLEDKIKSTFIFMKELTSSLFEQRINEIDQEISLTQEKNERELNNFRGTEQEKERLRIRQQAEEEKLEAKKRKEQQKQLNANKAFSIAQTIWNTSQAIMKAYADLGPIAGTVAAVIVGTLGAFQINRIANTEVPKYKKGRKGGPEEIAIVGDGGVHEIIKRKNGTVEMTPDTDTLVKLNEGDSVYSSVEEYNKRMGKLHNTQIKDYLQKTWDQDLLKREMQENTKQIMELQRILKNKNMTTTVNVPKMDLGHELWRLKQIGGLK